MVIKMTVSYFLHSINSVASIYGLALPTILLMAVTCSVFGVFVVLKRVVFIGVTLSEVAACGVALGLVSGFHPFLGSIILTLAVVGILAYPFEFSRIPRDAVLGVIFILASGMSILLVSKSGFGLEKVKAILFGSLLFSSTHDLIIIFAVLTPALLYLLVFLRPTLYSFLDRETSLVLGIRVQLYELIFFAILGLVVAVSSKIAGVMLVFCYLVVGPATALIIFRRFKSVLVGAALFSLISTFSGIQFSYLADVPPNQSVAVAACIIFVLSLVFVAIKPKGRAVASVVTLILALALLLLASHFVEIPETRMVENKTEKFQPVKPIEDYNEPDDPMTESEKIVELLSKDKKTGLKKAVKFLQKNPPDFFKNDVIQAIEKSIKHHVNWNKKEDGLSKNNKDVAEQILLEAKQN